MATLREAADSDPFTKRLMKLCERVQREGESQKARLAVLRSDYMLHEPDGAPSRRGCCRSSSTRSPPRSRACRTACRRSTRTSRRAGPRCAASSGTTPGARRGSSSSATRASSPPTRRSSGSPRRSRARTACTEVATPRSLRRPAERAQRPRPGAAPPGLWAAHGLRVISRTLGQLAVEANWRATSGASAAARRRRCRSSTSAPVHSRRLPSAQGVSTRPLLERSHAIPCPSVAQHLAGCHRACGSARARRLERFLPPADCEKLRSVFAGQWSLAGPAEPADDAPRRRSTRRRCTCGARSRRPTAT